MSNHYHLVVKISPSDANHWSDDEVLMRWTSLFRGPILVQRYRNSENLADIELESLRSIVAVFRSRLSSLSWFMKCLNEPIARKANAEDHCTGHFWEARFYSEPLCSEQSLIAAMAYVDLNPIRAKISTTPETSSYTSIKSRLSRDNKHEDQTDSVRRLLESGELNHFNVPFKPLKSFTSPVYDQIPELSEIRNNPSDDLPIYETEYLKLVDITGRVVVRNKRGRIDPSLAPILERLNLSTDQWIQASSGFRQYYRRGHLLLKAGV